MKKFILISVMLPFIAIASFGQETANVINPPTAANYLAKSRAQKTGAFICLGISATILAVTAKGNINFDALEVLAGIGLSTAITSVPLFIASGRNKRKAKLAASREKTSFGFPNRNKYINGLSIKIPLGKS